MKPTRTLALSLLLLGSLSTSADAVGRDKDKAFTLLGKTVCFKDTPRLVTCDYRLPVPAPKVVAQVDESVAAPPTANTTVRASL
jgi:hypothetical protein